MFDFSTETIINNLSYIDDNSITKARIIEENNPLNVAEKQVNILQVGKFPKFDSTTGIKTVGFFKVEPVAPVKEVMEIDLAGLTLADLTGHVLLLALDVILQGSQDGAYAQFAVHKGEPFYVEHFVKASTASLAALATELAATADRALQKGSRRQLTVTATGTKIVVTATTPYQRFYKGVVIDNPNGYTDMSNVIAEGTVTIKGTEGTGNYWQLTKNLRIPTNENIRFGGTEVDERLVVGAQYIQYTLQLEAERNFTGQSAVGQKLESKTNHTLFVLSTLEAAFEANFTNIITAAGWVDPTA